MLSPSHVNKKASNFNQHKQNSRKLLNDKKRSSSQDEDTPNFENNNLQTDTCNFHYNYDTYSNAKGSSSNGQFQPADYDTSPNMNKKYTRERSKMFSFGFGLN